MTTENPAPTTGDQPAEAPPATFPAHDWPGLAALVAPILRVMNRTVGSEDPDFEDTGVLAMASGQALVDALYAAGVLVFTDTTDRAHLRKSWAAMSTALIHLSQDRELTPDVLAAVPSSHRFYLMGHQAAHAQLTRMYGQLLGARLVLEGLLSRGTTPTPAELGEVVALLGGEDPYAGGRPVDADPWWGCWTAPAAAGPEAFRWETYARTCDPAAQLDGLGDLCAFLGGTWAESTEGASLTAAILRLIVKAQGTPERFAATERAFPREVTAWRVWMSMSPSPTAAELYAELSGELPVIDEAALPMPTPPGAVYAADEQALQKAIGERAAEVAGCIVVRPDGWPELLRAQLPESLRVRVPVGARAYALPWPAGTRAVYDPVAGVQVRQLGADKTGMTDVEVIARDLFVSFGDGGRCLLGTVRRLSTHEMRRGHGRRWWECRHCHLGAVGAVDAVAERAECLGHEAICPDQDRMDLSIPRTAGAGRPRSAISPGDPDWVPGFGPVPGASLGEDM